MKTIPERYECEICQRQYSSPTDALECESQVPDEYPVGLIFGNHENNNTYHDITFAIAVPHIDGHSNYSSMWACRDNGYGDSIGDNYCGSGNSVKLTKHHGHLDRNHPTFKRMVKFLKLRGVTITIWDGEKAVPYEGE